MTIRKCYIETWPDFAESGGRPHTYTVVWHVEADGTTKFLLPQEVLREAQALVSNAEFDAVPKRGASMELPMPGSNGLATYDDANVFALDIFVRQKTMSQNQYSISVVYRAPNVGAGEIPEGLLQFPDDPTQRDFEVWNEFIDAREAVSEGYLLDYTGSEWAEQSWKRAFTYTNKEKRREGAAIPSQLTVIVHQYESKNANEAAKLNQQYKGTTNNAKVKVNKLTDESDVPVEYEKHQLAYLRATSSRKYNNGYGTFTIQVRWAVDQENLHRYTFPNEGNWVLKADGSKGNAPKMDEGIPIQPPYPLTWDGQYLEDASGTEGEFTVRRYRIYEEIDFTAIEPNFFDAGTPDPP